MSAKKESHFIAKISRNNSSEHLTFGVIFFKLDHRKIFEGKNDSEFYLLGRHANKLYEKKIVNLHAYKIMSSIILEPELFGPYRHPICI